MQRDLYSLSHLGSNKTGQILTDLNLQNFVVAVFSSGGMQIILIFYYIQVILICLYTAPHRNSASLLVSCLLLWWLVESFLSTIFCCVSFLFFRWIVKLMYSYSKVGSGTVEPRAWNSRTWHNFIPSAGNDHRPALPGSSTIMARRIFSK